MRPIVFAAIMLGGSVLQPAIGACPKPEAPSCALTGSFASAADWDKCRLQMIDYKSGMEASVECLRDEGGDEQAAKQTLENALSEFNRRSRELSAEEQKEKEPEE